jgi:hypothetical protein
MPDQVCMGAMMTCSFGVAPGSLIVLPTNKVMTSNMPAANIMDHIPMVNIPTFGMCNSTTNPAVIALTAAALGVHTPAPCIPATVAPWAPGASKTMIANMPALDNSCTLNCLWSGEISFSQAGQTQCTVT